MRIVAGSNMRRRTRYDIYLDTLETIRRNGIIGITRISYGANMPIDRTKAVIGYLSDRGLLKEEEHGNTRGFTITARGGEFLQALLAVKMYLNPRGLKNKSHAL